MCVSVVVAGATALMQPSQSPFGLLAGKSPWHRRAGSLVVSLITTARAELARCSVCVCSPAVVGFPQTGLRAVDGGRQAVRRRPSVSEPPQGTDASPSWCRVVAVLACPLPQRATSRRSLPSSLKGAARCWLGAIKGTCGRSRRAPSSTTNQPFERWRFLPIPTQTHPASGLPVNPTRYRGCNTNTLSQVHGIPPAPRAGSSTSFSPDGQARRKDASASSGAIFLFLAAQVARFVVTGASSGRRTARGVSTFRVSMTARARR